MLGKKTAPAAEEENIKEQAQHDPTQNEAESSEARPMLGEKTPLAAEEENLKGQIQHDPTLNKPASSDTKPTSRGKGGAL